MIKPMLFNTDMVRAILDGRKTVTRWVVKPQKEEMRIGTYITGLDKKVIGACSSNGFVTVSPHQPGDILYVREAWSITDNLWNGMDMILYKADYNGNQYSNIRWRPSIHMPKEAARIFLRVTGVRVERLQEPFFEQGSTIFALRKEGVDIGDQCRQCIDNYGWPCCNDLDPDLEVDEETGADTEGGSECGVLDRIRYDFARLWDSTIKPTDRAVYGWDANPWVWVIEFERCEKPEGWPGRMNT